MYGFGKLFKKIIDILGSIFAIIFFLPLSLLIAFLIKKEDGGPVFYMQTRVGQNGKMFSMWKFRSMVEDAHALKNTVSYLNESDGPTFKIKNDPRITNIGKFLRKHSLDEIPQFINVLKGEMSLVGPRPALPEEVAQYSSKEMVRLTVIPGITGLWQVSGRSKLTYQEMIQLDLDYIHTWSLLADLKILFMTVWQMFSKSDIGAY